MISTTNLKVPWEFDRKGWKGPGRSLVRAVALSWHRGVTHLITSGPLGAEPECQSSSLPCPALCRRNHFVFSLLLLTNVPGLMKRSGGLSISTEMGVEDTVSCEAHPRPLHWSSDLGPKPGSKSVTSANRDFLGEETIIFALGSQCNSVTSP